MQAIETSHHRNGICGNPFSVGIVKDTIMGKEKKLLIVQFNNDPMNTAVFDLGLLKLDVIKFGENSFRGDNFADDFRDLVVDN